MRTTKASAAVNRLNARDHDHEYSMSMSGDGLFRLLRATGDAPPETISEPLPLEEFVALANRTGPQKAVKVSKLDAAFERQLSRGK
ncbi:MAG: hypothetical protein ACTHL1_10815 [Burkholderiaceae bacterium]